MGVFFFFTSCFFLEEFLRVVLFYFLGIFHTCTGNCYVFVFFHLWRLLLAGVAFWMILFNFWPCYYKPLRDFLGFWKANHSIFHKSKTASMKQLQESQPKTVKAPWKPQNKNGTNRHKARNTFYTEKKCRSRQIYLNRCL